MTVLPEFIKQIEQPVYKYRYSICTLVTRKQEYQEMLDSFLNAGFTTDICEYLVVDNSEFNRMDAYQGVNSFLQSAGGEYIIICHQDIVLINNNSKQLLDQQLAEITSLDPKWAVLGNAGAVDRLYNRLAIKIAYPDGFVDLGAVTPTGLQYRRKFYAH